MVRVDIKNHLYEATAFLKPSLLRRKCLAFRNHLKILQAMF